MNFNRAALIRFYDDLADKAFADTNRGAHVAAITGLIGEDLLLGLFAHHYASQEPPLVCEFQPEKCKAPGKKGKRLDAWVTIGEHRLAQVEIKNWSAHSLGERPLALDADEQAVKAAARKRWKEFFGNNDKMPSSALKILLDMPPPDRLNGRDVEKVLCFWLPLAQDEVAPMTTAQIMGKTVNVFSGSIYLRQLRRESLELDVPRVEARLRLLALLQGQVVNEPRVVDAGT